jgi:hypothetical protein
MAQDDNQLCVFCKRHGRYVKAEHCDHIEPFNGLDDPKRLDPANLQPVCARHNALKRHGMV